MKEQTREYLHTSRPYLSMLIGGAIGAVFGGITGNWIGLLFGQFFGVIVAILLSKPINYRLSGCIGFGTALLAVVFVLLFARRPGIVTSVAILAMIFGVVVIGTLTGLFANYCRTSHTIRNVFHSPRFLVGFSIIVVIVMTAILYPMIDTRDPMYSYGDMFLKPGTYFSIYDANIAAYNSTTVHRILVPEATKNRESNFLPVSQLEVISQYLARKFAWERDYTVRSYYYTKTDGTRGDARNLQKDVEDRIAALTAQVEEKMKDIEAKQQELDSDASMPEAKKNRYQTLIAQRQAEIDELNAAIEQLNARFSAGMIILDDEALRLWSEETGLEPTNEYRAQLLQLWTENYEKIMQANSGEELAALAVVEKAAETENEAETETVATAAAESGLTLAERYGAFNNGTDFITNENGLGFSQAEARNFVRIGRAMNIDANGSITYTQTNSTGNIEPIVQDVSLMDYTSVDEVANAINLPLGSDNNGRDMLLLLISAVGKSLLIGLLAGTIATLLGLLVGLLAGYVGGIVDDVLTFIMNIFTVIPGFVLMIIIYNMVDKSQRGIIMCGLIIGLTSWVWTARSVRSQVISLRNRDHVNLSKLSGHSLFRIILTDILPYIASYVVMAFILQVSSGILAEAQLSILGLGPSMTDGSTLGLMMNWAKLFGAYTSSNAWWAYFPVIGTIALISFSLNLMNTGLDQVFNPTLRD